MNIKKCLQRNAKAVVLLARNPLSKENNLFTLFPNRVESISCDVTDRKQLEQVHSMIIEKYGQIDFVFCSGNILQVAPFLSFSA